MNLQDLYTAENMDGEEYNVSDSSLSFTPSRLNIQVQPGCVKEGSFTVSGPAGIAVIGYISSGSLHMSCERTFFTENPSRIGWRFDATALKDGDFVDGFLRILTNCGEYKLPFHAEAAVQNINSRGVEELESRGSASVHLLELAKGDWHSAVRMFYRRDFAASLNTDRERMLYRGLSQSPGNEQNVEEFLIAACGIEPVEFSSDTKEIRTELYLRTGSARSEPREYSFRILRKGYGYTNLEVTLPGDYIRPVSARIEADDFIGNVCEFPYTVDPSRLHAGRNFGSIILRSPYQTIRIPIEIICHRNTDSQIRQQREIGHILVDLMRAYEKLHISWALQAQSGSGESRIGTFDSREWVRQTRGYIQRLTYLDRGSILPALYNVQLLLMDSRVHQAILELEAVRRKLAGVEQGEVLEMSYSKYRGETDIEYCYRQFLTALAYNDAEGITPRVARLLRERYRRVSSDWRIALMLLQLSPEYAAGTASRWNFLKKQFLNGCRSPLIYLEAWDMIAADSGFLRLQEDRRSGRYGGDAFERQVLLYASRKGLLDMKSMETVLELTNRRRSFSPTLFRILTRSYDDGGMRSLRDKILYGICTMLIRGNNTDASGFVWYSRAVERKIGVTRLPDYYLRSMPEDYCGIIPDSVIRNTSGGKYLIGTGKAYFYRYLYENRRNYPAVYAGYQEDIRQFLHVQIEQGRMSRNLAVLYTACLSDEKIRPDNANDLVRLSYLSLVRTTHMEIRRVVILYAQSTGERIYQMERGNCMLPVYGDDNLILLEDDRRCRFTESIPYTCDRMMQPVQNAAFIPAVEMSDLPFAMEMSGIMTPDFRVDAENLQNCEMLVRAFGISAKYRLRLKLCLLRYYEEAGEKARMEQMLQTLDLQELETDQRAEVIGRMHRCGLDGLAAEWMQRLGVEGISGKTIEEICLNTWKSALTNRQSASNAVQMPSRIGDLAWESFLLGERSLSLLDLLLSEFTGLCGELEQIRDAAAAGGFDQQVTAAEERIMKQNLFTGKVQLPDRILRFYRLGGPLRVLAEAALAQYCHYVFAGVQTMAPDLMKLIGIMDRGAENLSAVIRLAYLRTLSRRSDADDLETQIEHIGEQTEITGAEHITAQRFLASLMRDEIFFPFYRQLGNVGADDYAVMAHSRETMIEYHGPAGMRNAKGHVVIHCALARGGNKEPFTAREMKEMYRGFYVSSFYLFRGEQIHYFITDDPEEKNIVESGTAAPDERIQMPENDRFDMVDALSESVITGNRRETLKKLEDYRRLEYLVRTLFGSSQER